MKKVVRVAAITLLMMGLATISFAQEFEGGPAQGKKEVSLLGMMIDFEGDTVWTIQGSLGNFFTKQILAGVSIGYSSSKSEGVEEEKMINYGVFGKYHFVGEVPKRTVPYVGIAVSSYGNEDSTTIYGANAGIKHFITEGTALFVEYNVLKPSESDDGGTLGIMMFGLASYF